MTVFRPLSALFMLFSLAVLALSARAELPLSDAEARGKHIYIEGESTSGRVITAAINLSDRPASASILPCAQCHGAGGEGIGIVAPDIRWQALTDPDGHEHERRQHEPFDAPTLARAIREGVDPAGNELDATMPRYRMTDADMADLIAYLNRVGLELDPGLSASSIRIGTVLPTEGPLAEVGGAALAVIVAMFADVNMAGGIHDRKLELVVGEYGAEDTPVFWQAQDLVARESVFALFASYMPGYETELSTLVADKQIPHIGPNSLLSNESGGQFEFYVQPTVVEQSKALISFALTESDDPRLAIVYPRIKGFDQLVASAREHAATAGQATVLDTPYALGEQNAGVLVPRLKQAGVRNVLFLGSAQEMLEFARAADQLGWYPSMLSPAQFAERGVWELPEKFSGQILLSYPALADDYTPSGIEEFESLHEKFRIGYANSVAQIAAFSSTKVLFEALERAGPGLSRDALIAALEEFGGFEPGLSPPISFDAGRRLGVRGAYVLRVDLDGGRLDSEKRWVSID
jgi:ABC-type branched-subunit amino acid transport system substrate-binding protein